MVKQTVEMLQQSVFLEDLVESVHVRNVSDSYQMVTVLSVAVASCSKAAWYAEQGRLSWRWCIYLNTYLPTCSDSPHDPVPFMGSPVEMAQVNKEEVSPDLDALLVVDTTKGNRVINTRGFAISPTVKEGYVLRTSEDLLDLMQITTGRLPYVFPLATQDITPYGNDVHHLNSILQPCTATECTSCRCCDHSRNYGSWMCYRSNTCCWCWRGCKIMLEVAKAYGRKQCSFYDADEYARLQKLYGSMKHLQTLGNE